MKDLLRESHFVEMSDDDLKEHLGYLYEAVKDLKSQMKTDPEIERMTEALKAYKEDNFTSRIKYLSKLLKAASTVASLRGLHWDVKDEL